MKLHLFNNKTRCTILIVEAFVVVVAIIVATVVAVVVLLCVVCYKTNAVFNFGSWYKFPWKGDVNFMQEGFVLRAKTIKL